MPRTRRKRRPPSPSSASSGPPSSAHESAKADAYRLIARRTRTRKEVRGKLRQRGHREEVIEETLDSLTDLGYLDDAAFARDWCRYRLEARPLGVRGLRQELFEKGVPPDLAEEVLREAFENVDETELARRLATQRAEKGFDTQTAKGIKRMRDFLLRRGFSIESVNEVLAAAADSQWNAPEEQMDEP